MRSNIELKARVSDLSAISECVQNWGAHRACSYVQHDTYFWASGGRLKLRQGTDGPSSMIYYCRRNVPGLRKSDFEIVQLPPQTTQIGQILERAIGIRATINKDREVFEFGGALINLDRVEGLGQFVEVEVDIDKVGDIKEATRLAESLISKLGISPCDMIPWSYSDLAIMYQASAKWRKKLRSTAKHGAIFLIDGVSCSGKTTLVRRLAQDPDLRISYIPRYSTRRPRTGDDRSEYLLVSRERFASLADTGAFVEYRDFEFGMSYGLPWKQLIRAVTEGNDCAGIVNLGNICHIRSVLPEAVTMLVHAPVETIRNRLVERGSNTPEQIEERVENARRAEAYRRYYHHIVENDDGMMERAYEAIKNIVVTCHGKSPVC